MASDAASIATKNPFSTVLDDDAPLDLVGAGVVLVDFDDVDEELVFDAEVGAGVEDGVVLGFVVDEAALISDWIVALNVPVMPVRVNMWEKAMYGMVGVVGSGIAH